jgi:hypothetical protein
MHYHFQLLIAKFNNYKNLLLEWYEDNENYKYLKELWLKNISFESLINMKDIEIEQCLENKDIYINKWPKDKKDIFLQNLRDSRNTIYKRIKRFFSSIPEKLKRLSEQFYKNNDFILDNSKRSEEEINYDYFKENPNDFMQHKSICFSLKELYLFHNIVRRNEPAFIEKGKPLEKVLNSLSKFISSQQDIDNHYYVIISDNYNKEAKELLFHKEETKPLGTAKTKEEIIQNLHYCISFLIGKMEILPHWEWVVQNYKTEDTFENINEYLNSYEEINILCNDSIPLNWYSLYIINNLKNVSTKEAMNDYQILYDDIEKQIREQLKRISRLNEFLTVNMTNKFLLIDNKIKIF